MPYSGRKPQPASAGAPSMNAMAALRDHINDPPLADPALTVDDTVTVAVQVNGKLRATIELPRDCDNGEAEVRALAEAAVQRALDGKSPRKVIVVKNRIVNVVA